MRSSVNLVFFYFYKKKKNYIACQGGVYDLYKERVTSLAVIVQQSVAGWISEKKIVVGLVTLVVGGWQLLVQSPSNEQE